jgi:hypothetical protein
VERIRHNDSGDAKGHEADLRRIDLPDKEEQMTTIGRGALAASLILVFLMSVFPTPSRAVEAPRITKEELKARLGAQDVVVVDARIAHDWTESDSKIKGAVRENPNKVNQWIDKYPKAKTLIFY